MEPWRVKSSTVGLLSRSMWSLALICEWRRNSAKSESVVVFLPDYFCDSSILPMRALGAEINFYPINSDLTIDLVALRQLCSQKKPDLLVMVHYFGMPSTCANELREIARNTGGWLIEDCAHCVVPGYEIGIQGDFVLFSPHKVVPVPSGAVLVIRPDGPSRIGLEKLESFGKPSTWTEQALQIAKRTGVQCIPNWRTSLAWVVKRLVQRMGSMRKPRHASEKITDNDMISALGDHVYSPSIGRLMERSLAALVEIPKKNTIARKLLAGVPLTSEMNRMIRIRQANIGMWDGLVAQMSNGHVKPVQCDVMRYVPYLASYEGTEDSVSALYSRLVEHGLPVTTWPDLPPEVVANPSIHTGALALRRCRIFLPVHHSVRAKDIVRVVKSVGYSNQVVESKVSQRQIEYRSEWDGIFARVLFTNLLQSWDYGDAKVKAEGWSARRIVYSYGGRDVAVAQFLERQMFGLIRVKRLSRGPLFLSEVDPAIQSLVIATVAMEGAWYRRSVLSIAPEVHVGAVGLPLGGLTSLQWLSPVGSESLVLDLSLANEERRRQLNGKWRNQLVAAEKSGAVVRHSQKEVDFELFEIEYKNLIAEKEFQGIPLQLFRSIWTATSESRAAHLFISEIEGNSVGAILVVEHGATATYLAGWNGPEGRRTNSNNFMLWEASGFLKAAGVRWFDLGGLDEMNTTTISKFKLGMGGGRYRTLGEYIAL